MPRWIQTWPRGSLHHQPTPGRSSKIPHDPLCVSHQRWLPNTKWLGFLVINLFKATKVGEAWDGWWNIYGWWNSGIRLTMVNSPVEVGKFIQLLIGFYTCQVVFSPDFWTINYVWWSLHGSKKKAAWLPFSLRCLTIFPPHQRAALPFPVLLRGHMINHETEIRGSRLIHLPSVRQQTPSRSPVKRRPRGWYGWKKIPGISVGWYLLHMKSYDS